LDIGPILKDNYNSGLAEKIEFYWMF